MKFYLGADTAKHRVLHLEGCRLAKVPFVMLEGVTTDDEILRALGASVEWTTVCERCMPKLHRKLEAAASLHSRDAARAKAQPSDERTARASA